MVEQWQIQWKDYYQILQLRLDVEPEVITAVYKKLAVKYHPDNKETGDEGKFKLLNEAHEVLSDPEKRAVYDQEYTLHHLPHKPQSQTPREDHHQRAAAMQSEQAEQQQRADRARQQRQAEDQRRRELPIVYPLYRATSLWSVVNNALNRVVTRLGLDDGGATVFGLLGGFMLLIIPLALILRLFAFVLGVSIEQLTDSRMFAVVFVLWFGLGSTFLWGNLIAVNYLDPIHTARRPRIVWISPSQVWLAMEHVLHTYRYHGHAWAIGEKTDDASDATEKLIARCAFSYKLLGLVAVPYTVTVTMKVKEADSVADAKVCYWFDAQNPWFWLWPGAIVVKQTNESLQKALPGLR